MTDVLPDASRVTARRALTRDKLMNAATEVFAARGIPGASVEEICEAAGFTRGAFYSNFADKDALVLALIEQGIQFQYDAAERAVAELRNDRDDFTPEQLVSHVLTRFVADGRSGREWVLTQQELLLHAAREPGLRGRYLVFADACADQLATLLTDALAFGGLEFSLPFADALELLTATHSHMQMQALFTGEPDSHLLHTLVMSITRPVAANREQ
jgi:AcrR family transcriptional regulator